MALVTLGEGWEGKGQEGKGREGAERGWEGRGGPGQARPGQAITGLNERKQSEGEPNTSSFAITNMSTE